MNKVVKTLEVENLIFNIRRTGDVGARGVDNLGRSLRNLHKSSANASKGLGALLHTIGRLAKMMVLRQAIRAIMKALSEGLKNAYMFNSAVGGQMSQALDQLKSASVQATGAIGSAFGELLANVSPVLISILNLVSRVADALAQLFAVLGGRSQYTKAIASSEKWAKATQSGSKAAKEWKNQLLGFDEINRLEAPSDSGSGSGTPAYNGAFELAEANNEWAKQLREITMDWWNNLNFEPIIEAWGRLKDAVGEFVALVDTGLKWAYENVLLPFAGWVIEIGLPAAINFLADAISYLTNILSSLAQKAKGAKSFGEFLKSLDGDEVTVFAIATAIAAVVTACLGFKVITGIVGLATTAFQLLTSPIGIAITVLTALVAAGVAVYKNWDTIKQKAGELWGAIKSFFSNIGEKFSNFIHSVGDPLIDFFDNLIEKVKAAFEWIAGLFSFIGGTSSSNISAAEADGSIYLQGFAAGGYPDEGELFMARENGVPEMVGSIGGRTAVATNSDIVAAVSSGVAEAVASVMGGGSSQPVSVKVYLDSREIKAGQQRLARAMGS